MASSSGDMAVIAAGGHAPGPWHRLRDRGSEGGLLTPHPHGARGGGCESRHLHPVAIPPCGVRLGDSRKAGQRHGRRIGNPPPAPGASPPAGVEWGEAVHAGRYRVLHKTYFFLPLTYPSPTSRIPLTYIFYGGDLHRIYTKAAATALIRVASADSARGMCLFLTLCGRSARAGLAVGLFYWFPPSLVMAGETGGLSGWTVVRP